MLIRFWGYVEVGGRGLRREGVGHSPLSGRLSGGASEGWVFMGLFGHAVLRDRTDKTLKRGLPRVQLVFVFFFFFSNKD